jgi:hypothetical protein
LLFIMFLISILVLEGILRHDEAKTRKIKQLPISQARPLPADSDGSSTGMSNVLTLAKAIERHSREARRPMAPQPSRPVTSPDHSLDPAITPVAPTGSRPLK